MRGENPFDTLHGRYEAWFEKNRVAYLSELLAVRAALPCGGRGLEIGVGAGHFAAPLGVKFGLDPSPAMLDRATERGIVCVRGVGEGLPFRGSVFDHLLVVTALCFMVDAAAAVSEVRRVLKPEGVFVLAFMDADSSMGKACFEEKSSSPFYSAARLFSAAGVAGLMRDAGFSDIGFLQTVSSPPDGMAAVEPAVPGHGKGLFTVARGVKG